MSNPDWYLDPPEIVSWAKCEMCGNTYDLGDMTEVHDDEWICDECLEEYCERHPEEE